MDSDDIPKYRIRNEDRGEEMDNYQTLFSLFMMSIMANGFRLSLWEQDGKINLTLVDIEYIKDQMKEQGITEIPQGELVTAPATFLHEFSYGFEHALNACRGMQG